jgi:two-component system, cell cycle sensor histidine kinase and response regulator CckA
MTKKADIPSSPKRSVPPKEPRPKTAETTATVPLFDESYRILFDTMSQGVIFRDHEGRILSVNPAAERIFGRKTADLIGKTSAEVHEHALRENGSRLPTGAFPAEVALRTGQPLTGFIMATLNPLENEYRWISVDAMPIFRPEEQQPYLVYILFEDITERRRMTLDLKKAHDHLEQEVHERTRELVDANDELSGQIEVRKKAEAALQESEATFRRLAENADDLIYLYRLWPERKFEYVSPSVTAMTGYTPDEHYANPDLGLQIVHVDDRGMLKDVAAGTINPRQPLTLRWVRKDGRVIWAEQRNIPITDASGRIIALQGIARDITDRVNTEEKLRESEKFLQTVIDTEPACVKMLAKDGSLLMMNRAGLDMIQADTIDQVRGQSIYGLVMYDHRRKFAELTESVFAGRSGILAFEAMGLKGRAIWLETHAVPLRDEKNTIIAALGITRDITEHVRTLQKLRENEKFLQTVIDTEPECVKMLGADGTLLMMNRAGLEMLQVDSLDQVKGKVATPLVASEHRRAFAALLMNVFRGKGGRLTFEMIGLKGRRLWMDTHMVPLRDEKNNIIAALGITRDITERKQSEDALQKSEQRYKQLLESVTNYIYTVIVEQGKAVSTVHGPGCVAVTGYAAGEYAADPYLWYRMVHDQDKQMVLRQAEDVLAGGHPGPIEHRVRHKSGVIVWVRSTVVPHTDEEGKLTSYDGLIADITAQKRAETFSRNILETVDEGFLVIDRNYTVLSANKAISRLVGMDAQDMIGRKCYDVSHKIARPCYDQGEDCAVRHTFETELPHTVVHTHHDAQGNSLSVETKAFPLRDETGRVVAAIEIINNITDKKRLEDQLRHSQKMEAVGLLAGGISHDFNNILTAIIGYANLLKMKTPADDPLQPYIEQILASSARAANLTQGLLAFSRKQVINPHPLDINDAIRRFEKLLYRVIGEDVELRTELAPMELTVFADSGQMEQVLMNLATNARDAMPQGGALTVRTEIAVIGSDFRKEYEFVAPGSYACVSVCDTGNGMDQKTRDHIFEPFFTTKEPGKGTGLGLSIIYGIMKQHNGYILVDSTPGEGSCFRLYFPVIAATEDTAKADEQPSPEEGRETILIAEDDATIRQLTRTMLGEFGYTVIDAADGEEAVKKFREHRDAIKLIILDVVMPKMNGKEARDEIIAIKPDVKTLYISGYSADVLRNKGLPEDSENIILKPVSPMDLLRKIRRVLDNADPARKPLAGK